MGLLRLTLATCILFISGPAFAQSWIEYTSRQDHFSINFRVSRQWRTPPTPPQYEAEYPARVYTRQNGESRYSITVVDHTDAERIFKERGRLGAHSECQAECWIPDLYSAPNHAANEFLTRAAKVTYFGYSRIDIIGGHQIHLINPINPRASSRSTCTKTVSTSRRQPCQRVRLCRRSLGRPCESSTRKGTSSVISRTI